MKCSEIKLLLSEHIDNTLNEHDRSKVDNHVKDCEKCKSEYISLKNMLDELGELPKAKAPDDFLESLHARIESGIDMNAIIKKLFVPFKIKVPMQLVTAAASAVLIIFIVNIFQQEKPISNLLYEQHAEKLEDTIKPEETFGTSTSRQPSRDKGILKRKIARAPEGTEKQTKKETAKTVVSKTAGKQSFSMDKSAPAPAKEETRAGYVEEKEVDEPIELALLLDSKAVFKPDTAIVKLMKKDQERIETASTSEAKKKISDHDLSSVKTPADTSSRAPLPSRSITEQPADLDAAEGSVSEDEPMQSTEERIKAIIQKSNGRIINVNYDEQTNLPASILVEIPSSQMNSFYLQLARIGRIKEPLPGIDESTTKPLRVNINLISTP
jgi:hypothetical protein